MTTRATTSTAPPALNGTITVIARDGHSSAPAGFVKPMRAIDSAMDSFFISSLLFLDATGGLRSLSGCGFVGRHPWAQWRGIVADIIRQPIRLKSIGMQREPSPIGFSEPAFGMTETRQGPHVNTRNRHGHCRPCRLHGRYEVTRENGPRGVSDRGRYLPMPTSGNCKFWTERSPGLRGEDRGARS